MASFVLRRRYIFSRDVDIELPDGSVETVSVTYRLLTSAEQEEAVKEDGRFLREAVEAVDGITDETGATVPWCDATRDALRAYSFIIAPIVQAYFKSAPKAAEGN